MKQSIVSIFFLLVSLACYAGFYEEKYETENVSFIYSVITDRSDDKKYMKGMSRLYEIHSIKDVGLTIELFNMLCEHGTADDISNFSIYLKLSLSRMTRDQIYAQKIFKKLTLKAFTISFIRGSKYSRNMVDEFLENCFPQEEKLLKIKEWIEENNNMSNFNILQKYCKKIWFQP